MADADLEGVKHGVHGDENDDVSDTQSHLEDSDYERDGFVVDDDEVEVVNGDNDGRDDDEAAFLKELAENKDRYVTTRPRRRRAKKTAADEYKELQDDLAKSLEVMVEIKKERAALPKGKAGADGRRELDVEAKGVMEHIQLVKYKMKEMEVVSGLMCADDTHLESEVERVGALLADMEAERAEVEGMDGAAAGIRLEKLNQSITTQSRTLRDLEAQLVVAREERAVMEGPEDGGDGGGAAAGSGSGSGGASDSSSDSEFSDCGSDGDSDSEFSDSGSDSDSEFSDSGSDSGSDD